MNRRLRSLWEDIKEYQWPARYWPAIRDKVVSPPAVVLSYLFFGLISTLPRSIRSPLMSRVGKLLWGLRGSTWLRELLPPMRNLVYIRHLRADGSVVMEDYGFNLRTNQGRDWQCDRMSKPTGGPAAAIYIGCHSSSGYTPAAGDTESANWRSIELTANGFSRASGVYAHTPGNANYTLQKTFTLTAGSPTTVYGAAMLDTIPTGGNLFVARNFGTPATMDVNDSLQTTWDITV